MIRLRSASPLPAAAFAIAAALLSSAALAQAPAPFVPQTPGYTGKQLLAAPITGVEDKEVALNLVTLEPGASSPAHTHPGDCYGTVLEGTMELRVEGEAVPRRLTAGQSYMNLANPAHQFINVGDKPVRLVTALVVERGKPRVVTVPV